MVSAGDVIGLQHNAGPASLLQCQSSPTSLWRQPVLVLNHSEWLLLNTSRDSEDSSAGHSVGPRPHLDLESPLEAGKGNWLEESVCPIRVLYVGHSEISLQGAQLSAGLSQPGQYTLQVRHKSMPNLSMRFTHINHVGATHTEYLLGLIQAFDKTKNTNITLV